MIPHTRTRLLVALTLTLSACGDAPPDDTGILARAGDMTWTVDDAAELIAADEDTPAQPQVVDALAELWIDYTLLAAEAARDSTLAGLDVTPLVDDLVAEQLILALRDSTVSVEPLTAEELTERYRTEAPGSLIRARQLVVAWPRNATEEDRDSVRARALSLRARIVDGGEDFGALARRFSDDSLTARAGGALGLVGRTSLRPEVSEVLFGLESGQVSPPVETEFGVHLLQAEELMMPTVERFRADLLARRTALAESTYVASLEARALPHVEDGAAERVRTLARNYRTPLSDGEGRRTLMSYEGGSVTQAEVLWYLQTQDPALRNAIATSDDDEPALRAIRSVAHRELLTAETRRRGWSVPQEAQDAVAATARGNLVEVARQLGLLPIEPDLDQLTDDAVHEAVEALLSDLLSGARREVAPLGAMSYVLRRATPSRVVDANVDETVARIQAIRSGGPSQDGS